MALVVRPARNTDAVQLGRLILSIFPSSRGEFSDSDRIWVAEENGKSVGFVRFSLQKERWVLNGLGTIPEKRDQGVGSQLLDFALREMESEPRPIYLKVKALNPAVGLYERFGFVMKKFGKSHVLVRKART